MFWHLCLVTNTCDKTLLNKILNIDYDNNSDPVIILHGENWHEGIIGIIAARLKEKFNKPSIIISSIEEIDNTKILKKITDVLGKETKKEHNTPLFYIYDDGTVEKKISIE